MLSELEKIKKMLGCEDAPTPTAKLVEDMDVVFERASIPIYAPDPFLDAQEYAHAMASAGKSVNLTLRSEYEKMGVTV